MVTTESELIVNTVKTNKPARIPTHEAYDSTFSNSLFNFNLNYNSKFWENYSALVPTGLVGKALEDLESKTSLEKQFQEKK